MPHSKTRQAMAYRDERTINMRNFALILTICVVAGLILAFLFRQRRESPWAQAQGTIQDTRIVADNALETKWGGQLTWKAEYRVAYSVAGHEYVVWADSGIRGDDEAAVRLLVPQSRRSCKVQYNTQRPEASVADCR